MKEEKEVFTRGLHKSVRGRGSRDGGKTAYEMFLEDDGPYSRKLYPPLTPGIKKVMTLQNITLNLAGRVSCPFSIKALPD